ncbi:hypothetical protein GGI35DRAFT_335915 [Trichoderma velutinum]
MDRSYFLYFLYLSLSFSSFLYLSVPLRISDMYNYLHCIATGSANTAYLCMLARYSCTLAFCIYRNTFSLYKFLIRQGPKLKSVEVKAGNNVNSWGII